MAVEAPEDLVARFEAAYNARDKRGLLQLYVPDAVHTFDGIAVSRGVAAIDAAFDRGFAGPNKLAGKVLQCLEADGIALIRAEWTSINPGGTIRNKSVSCEVAKQGADGLWRYLIDDATGGSRGVKSD